VRITIASGKGGVGKSMVASSLAILFSRTNPVVAIDCDVDAPNLALWLGIDNMDSSSATEVRKMSTTEKPQIDTSKCVNCNLCVTKCNFGALKEGEKTPELISYRCEGCGLCKIVCPHGAIKMVPVDNFTLSIFDTKYDFKVVQGQITPGEAESGEAVTEIRGLTKKFVTDDTVIIQDAAAGIGCPVIASIVNSDYVVIVCEPTKSSLSDAKRTIEVVNQFNIPHGVVINKHDLNSEISSQIRSFAGDRYLGKISYDKGIIKSIVDLEPIMETTLKAAGELESIYEKLVKKIL